MIKAIYEKGSANIIYNHMRLKSFPIRLGKIAGCPYSSLLFNVIMVDLLWAISEEK